jgi:hypothetical protein
MKKEEAKIIYLPFSESHVQMAETIRSRELSIGYVALLSIDEMLDQHFDED